MRKRLLIALAVMLVCLAAAMPAMAADVFKYAQESIQVFAGGSVTPELVRDGAFTEGEVTYSLNKTIATVDGDGTVAGVSPVIVNKLLSASMRWSSSSFKQICQAVSCPSEYQGT